MASAALWFDFWDPAAWGGAPVVAPDVAFFQLSGITGRWREVRLGRYEEIQPKRRRRIPRAVVERELAEAAPPIEVPKPELPPLIVHLVPLPADAGAVPSHLVPPAEAATRPGPVAMAYRHRGAALPSAAPAVAEPVLPWAGVPLDPLEDAEELQVALGLLG